MNHLSPGETALIPGLEIESRRWRIVPMDELRPDAVLEAGMCIDGITKLSEFRHIEDLAIAQTAPPGVPGLCEAAAKNRLSEEMRHSTSFRGSVDGGVFLFPFNSDRVRSYKGGYSPHRVEKGLTLVGMAYLHSTRWQGLSVVEASYYRKSGHQNTPYDNVTRAIGGRRMLSASGVHYREAHQASVETGMAAARYALSHLYSAGSPGTGKRA